MSNLPTNWWISSINSIMHTLCLYLQELGNNQLLLIGTCAWIFLSILHLVHSFWGMQPVAKMDPHIIVIIIIIIIIIIMIEMYSCP